jgi:YggT family protein
MSEPSTDHNLANDQARREVQHDAVKQQIEGDVNAEIASQAAPPGEARKIEQVAGTLRKHAVNEVVDTERAVQRSRGVARFAQVVDYLFFVVYLLLIVRFVLSLIAAKSSAGFVKFIVTLSNPFYAPFKGIVDSPRTDDGHTLMLPVLVALGAYVVLHLVIKGLFRLIATRSTEI